MSIGVNDEFAHIPVLSAGLPTVKADCNCRRADGSVQCFPFLAPLAPGASEVAEDRQGLRHTPVQARLLDHVPISWRAPFEAGAQIADTDQDDLMLVVLRGTVRVSMLAADGRQRVLAYLPEGSTVGEQRVLSGLPLDVCFSVFAETACVVGYVRAEDVWKAVSAHPELVRDLVINMRRKTMLYLDQLQQAAFENALSQISTILLSLDPGDGIVRISQDRLAHLSGKTRRTVGAQLHRLATMGVIDLNRAHVTIKNRERLALLAD
jgi:CRP/FNR family transcriptional regulator